MRLTKLFFVFFWVWLVPNVQAREATKPKKVNTIVGITTLASGGGLAILGAAQIMKIHSADDDDLYEDCYDDSKCERKKWTKDLRMGQQLFWGGQAIGLTGVAILIFKPFSSGSDGVSSINMSVGRNFAAVDYSW